MQGEIIRESLLERGAQQIDGLIPVAQQGVDAGPHDRVPAEEKRLGWSLQKAVDPQRLVPVALARGNGAEGAEVHEAVHVARGRAKCRETFEQPAGFIQSPGFVVGKREAEPVTFRLLLGRRPTFVPGHGPGDRVLSGGFVTVRSQLLGR